MSFHAKPPQRRVDDKYLDEHSQRHNKGGEASAIAEYYHNGKNSLQKCEDDECCPATSEEECGIARQHKIVGLEFVDNMQRDKHSRKES